MSTQPSNYLSSDELSKVVELTPLVSIDLIVEDQRGNILLGYRKNRPAKNQWFVPGGRILKDERLNDAFRRLTQDELGRAIPIDSAIFLGVYEHFYEDNFLNTDFSTHYVVLGYRIKLTEPLLQLPKEQHGEYRWFDKSELCANDRVHKYTKAYFQ